MGQMTLPFGSLNTPKASPEKRTIDQVEVIDSDENATVFPPSKKIMSKEQVNDQVIFVDSPESQNGFESKTENSSNEKSAINSSQNIADSSMISEADTSTQDISMISTTSENIQNLTPEEKKAVKEEKKRLREIQEAERLAKKQKLEEEKQQRKLQQEKEKLERQKKKEEEIRLREEKKQQLELEKQLKREEENRIKEQKRQQQELERQMKKEKLEEQKRQRELKRLQELEEKKQKELQRQQEKAEKERQKQLEKEEKERLEKAKEEKTKKQQITSFFKIAKPSSSSGSNSPLGAKSAIPILSPENAGSNRHESANLSSPVKHKSSYESYFLSFFVKANSALMRALPSDDVIENSKNEFEMFLSGQEVQNTKSSTTCNSRSSAAKPPTSFDVVQNMNMGMTTEAEDLLKRVPMKYLHFYENLKQPYCGSYSRTVLDVTEEIAINPFLKINPESILINYEYDSDLEEDEEDEGDDVENEEEDEEDENEVDGSASSSESDIDEFLEEDEESNTRVKKNVIGPLVPVVNWIGQKIDENQEDSNAAKAQLEFFEGLQYERLNETIQYPIDLMASYWDDPVKEHNTTEVLVKVDEASKSKNTGKTASKNTISTAVGDDSNKENQVDGSTSNKDNNSVNVLTPVKKKTIISSPEDISKLTEYIAKNSSFTMSTLSELIQKQVLPHYKKIIVKNTIQSVATFDPQKKEWVLNGVTASN